MHLAGASVSYGHISSIVIYHCYISGLLKEFGLIPYVDKVKAALDKLNTDLSGSMDSERIRKQLRDVQKVMLLE